MFINFSLIEQYDPNEMDILQYIITYDKHSLIHIIHISKGKEDII